MVKKVIENIKKMLSILQPDKIIGFIIFNKVRYIVKRLFILLIFCFFHYVHASSIPLSIPIPTVAEPEFQLLQVKDLQILVNKIVQDREGFLWFGTEQGLFKYDGYNIKKFVTGSDNKNISNNIVMDIVEDDKGNLWISTYAGGLNKYDPLKNSFKKFKRDVNANINISLADNLWDIEKSNSTDLWIGSRDWLYKFNVNTENYQRLWPNSTPPLDVNNNIWSVLEDSKGNLWLGTLGGGVYHYNPSTHHIIQYQHDPDNPQSLSHSFVRTIIEDELGNIWVGTDNGLNIFDSKKKLFKRYHHSPDDKLSLSGNEINRLYEDSAGRIWVGTYGTGLNLYDRTTDSFRRYNFNSLGLHESRTPKIINDILEDRQGILWFATEKGIVKLSPIALNINRMVLDDGQPVGALHRSAKSGLWVAFDHYLMNISPDSFKARSTLPLLGAIFDIAEDPSGNLWVTSENNGLHKVSPAGEKLAHYQGTGPEPSLPCNNIFSIYPETNNRIWLGFYHCNKVNGIALFEEGKGVTKRFYTDKVIADIEQLDDDHLLLATVHFGVIKLNIKTFEHTLIKHEKSLSLNQIIDIYISSSARVWLATTGGGLAELSLSTNQIKSILPAMGSINWIWETQNGELWISKESALIKYDPVTGSIAEFNHEDGLKISKYTARAITSIKGKLLIGSNNGLVTFNPESLKHTSPASPVKFTELRIFNRPIDLSEEDMPTPLKKPLTYSKEITLSHKDDLFSLIFSAMDYRFPESLTYKYKLEGFDDRWILTEASNRIATFSNLSPGNYVFRVKAIDKEGSEVAKEASLKVKILPPWWLTNFAYLMYIVLVFAFLYILIHLRTRSLKQRTVELERGVKERTIELESKTNIISALLEQKQRMFANISHEFRTPLTLILNPVEQFLGQKKWLEEKSILNSIKRNGLRLLQRVDQLLELARLDSSVKQTKVLYSFSQVVSLTVASFEPLATVKKQVMTVKDIDDVILKMLPNSLERIIDNLVSNAIKYTQEGGSIEITSHINEEFIVLSVRDSGFGIAPQYQQAIFERFNRGSLENNEHIPGAGIGLALVKELVELHQGKVSIDSQYEKGSLFYVKLPIYQGQYNKQELSIIPKKPKQWAAFDTDKTAVPLINEEVTHEDSRPLLLIVEDNADMREHLINMFHVDYRCIEASNGYEGLEMTKLQVPDAIICDVMMPKMNGYEFSKAIKQDEALSHIPIMLLTARADLESRMEGWRQHVDDYLTKPFNNEELRLRLDNLLTIRTILRKRFASEMRNNPAGLIQVKQELNVKDLSFINKFETLVEKQYKDTEFQLNFAAISLSMSERQLQRKLKALMDLTFSEYVRSHRLKKAAIRLQEGLPINRVVEEVGFSSPAYFSSCFKAEFGETPKQFQQKSVSLQRKKQIDDKS